jgi:hypothetical protein
MLKRCAKLFAMPKHWLGVGWRSGAYAQRPCEAAALQFFRHCEARASRAGSPAAVPLSS